MTITTNSKYLLAAAAVSLSPGVGIAYADPMQNDNLNATLWTQHAVEFKASV